MRCYLIMPSKQQQVMSSALYERYAKDQKTKISIPQSHFIITWGTYEKFHGYNANQQKPYCSRIKIAFMKVFNMNNSIILIFFLN